jgi:hypothetical protein
MKIYFHAPLGFNQEDRDTNVMPVPRVGETVLVMQTSIDHFGKSRIPKQKELMVYKVDYDLSEMCIDVHLND